MYTYRDVLFIYLFFPYLSSLSQLLRTFPLTSAINPTNHLLCMPAKSMLILRLIQSTSTSSQPPRAVATNAKSICYNALHTRSWVKLKSLWRDCRTLWRLAELTQLAALNSRLGRLSDLRLELSCVCHNLLRIPEAEQNLCTMLAFIGWLRNVDCCVNDMARKREREIESEIEESWRETDPEWERYSDRNPFISGKFVGGMNPS